MNVSHLFLEIVWRVTEVFFLLSLLLLILLFIVKKHLDKKKNFIKEKQLQYIYHDINEEIALSSNAELIAYSQVISMRLLSATEHEKRESIKQHIQKLHLFERLSSLYRSSRMYRSKLYIFASLVLFSDVRGRVLYHSVINNAHKRTNMPEFMILALFGLALSTEKKEHLLELYAILEQMDGSEYPTQKFSEFFLIQAFVSLDERELLHFFEMFSPEKFTSVGYALIYALQSLPVSKEIHSVLLDIYGKYSFDALLLVSILRLEYAWKLKDERLVLANHQHENDLVRIVCAKVGLEIIDSSKYHLLTHYLYDENPYVRKNFLVALSSLNISYHTVTTWIEKTYPGSMDEALCKRSLLLYKKGIL